MSESSTAMRPSRGKVWLPMIAGETLGRPLAEWGYQTPRFPQGIKGGDLGEVASEIQRETMIVWFLANHIPAKGPYFGFSGPDRTTGGGALNTAALNELPLNGSVEVAGFNQGRWFNGGTAADLLKAEFGNLVEAPPIAEVARLFPDLWEMLPPEPLVDLENQTPAERSATIAATLDELAGAVRTLAPQHGGMGHNGPPEDGPSMTEDEQRVVLKATENARLAVLSSDYSAANAAWEAARPVFEKIGSAVGRHVDTYCNKFTATLGVTTALMTTGYIGSWLGLWNKAQAITAMLELAKHLLH